MFLNMLKSKIHRALVTEANLNYVGSITIDQNLMDAAGLIVYEKVQVVNINNGERFETYVIAGKRESGIICLNGAAARLACVGDRVIIMAYCQLDADEAKKYTPTIVFVDEFNRVRHVSDYEKQGQEK